jgi:hypothetical protein
LLRREVYERLVARWAELGFSGPPPQLGVFHKDWSIFTFSGIARGFPGRRIYGSS